MLSYVAISVILYFGNAISSMWSIFSGENVAYYFAWMTFFTWSLLPIAIFGIALFSHRPKGITVDDSPYLPAYALLMALWTIVFTKVRINFMALQIIYVQNIYWFYLRKLFLQYQFLFNPFFDVTILPQHTPRQRKREWYLED